jgi:hypothetical protein
MILKPKPIFSSQKPYSLIMNMDMALKPKQEPIKRAAVIYKKILKEKAAKK